MDEEEALLELQLESEAPVGVVGGDAEGDRWAQIEEDIRQEQQEAREQAASDEGDEDDDDDHDNQHGEGSDDSDDDDGVDDGDKEAAEAAGAPQANGGDEDFTDEQLLAVEHKKEAKKLGKVLYKRWKKLLKRSSSSGSKDKKKKSKKDKKKSSKRESKSTSKKKATKESGESAAKKKRSRKATSAAVRDVDDAMDDIPFMTDEEANRMLMAEAGTSGTLGEAAARRTAAGARRAGGLADTHKRLTADQQRQANAQLANALIAEMRQAAKADEEALAHPERGARPLFRALLSEKVNSLCRRECLYGPLVEGGVLQELSQWLYSLKRNEPAPFELRTTALDVLLNFPIVGEVRVKRAKKNRNGEEISVDVNQFIGIEWEHLRDTDLGVAVNSLRQHAAETPSNRSKCIRLLERLSRSRHNDGEDADGQQSSSGPAQVYWRTKGDPTVASPFVTVQTGSEAFQKAIMKPDPRDPTSYNNYLPWRPTAVTVTNLSGDLLKVANGKIGDVHPHDDK